MTRILIDLDDEALAAAAEVLGTTTAEHTVNAALREVAGRRERVAKVRAAKYLHGDPEVRIRPDVGDGDTGDHVHP